MEIVERAVEVNAPVESVFELLSDFENYPLWMRAVGDVRRTGRRTCAWRTEAADGRRLQWETETVVFEPDRRIVWRSVGGDVDADGEVVLSETEYGTTLVRLVLGYAAPRGGVERLLGRHPARRLDEDLARFAHVAERRARDLRPPRYESARQDEHRREADEHGKQAARLARDRYQERDERHGRGGRRDTRDDLRSIVWGDSRGRREGPRFDEHERRHEEALREAHRRQSEDLHRYRDERERERREYVRAERDAGERPREEAREEGGHRRRLEDRARRAEALERRREDERPTRRRDEEPPPRPGDEERPRYARDDERGARSHEEEREYRPRYALTPRERGQFAGGPPRDDFERMSRRGVERLLDEDRPGRRRRRDD